MGPKWRQAHPAYPLAQPWSLPRGFRPPPGPGAGGSFVAPCWYFLSIASSRLQLKCAHLDLWTAWPWWPSLRGWFCRFLLPTVLSPESFSSPDFRCLRRGYFSINSSIKHMSSCPLFRSQSGGGGRFATRAGSTGCARHAAEQRTSNFAFSVFRIAIDSKSRSSL